MRAEEPGIQNLHEGASRFSGKFLRKFAEKRVFSAVGRSVFGARERVFRILEGFLAFCVRSEPERKRKVGKFLKNHFEKVLKKCGTSFPGGTELGGIENQHGGKMRKIRRNVRKSVFSLSEHPEKGKTLPGCTAFHFSFFVFFIFHVLKKF